MDTNPTHEPQPESPGKCNRVARQYQIRLCSINQLVPPQNPVRQAKDESHRKKLASSIYSNHVTSLPVVRQSPEDYDLLEIIIGIERVEAARAAGLTEIAVLYTDIDDAQALEMAVLDNLLHQKLNPAETLEAVLRLASLELGITHNQAIEVTQQALKVLRNNERSGSKSQGATQVVERLLEMFFITHKDFRANYMSLLQLPGDLYDHVKSGALEPSKAKVLRQLDNPAQRKALLDETLSKKLKRHEIEDRVKQIQPESSIGKTGHLVEKPTIAELAQDLDNVKQKLVAQQVLPHPQFRRLRRLIDEFERTLKAVDPVYPSPQNR